MEKFVINFLDFIISRSMVYGWKEFRINALFLEIKEDGRRIIREGTRIPIGENNWGDSEQISAIQQYLINRELADAVEEGEIKANSPLRFTKKGRKLVELGGVDKYNVYAKNREDLLEQVSISQVRSSLIAERQLTLSVQTFFVNVCIALSTGIAGVYYLLDIRQHHTRFFCPFSAFALGASAIVLVVWLQLRRRRR